MEETLTKDSVREHFNIIAKDYDKWKKKNAYYYSNIKTFIKKIVRPGSKVLEVGCGTGEILASTEPSYGIGIDISSEMVELAKEKFPEYTFNCSPIEEFRLDQKFDYIIMVDVVDHVYDVLEVFKSVYRLCHETTRIILTTINPWWDPILNFMEKFGAKMPEGPHNFIEKRNLTKIAESCDLTVNYSGYMLLFPKKVPLLSYLANTLGVRLWLINKLSAVQYMVLQPTPKHETSLGLGCSVIIPCYNEAENIEQAIKRIPPMGKKTEIIVVNDGSTDDTASRVKALQSGYADLKLIDYSPNKGKGCAVKQGFDAASQEILMILDADMTTPPEELPRFFGLLNTGKCQFVNGSRMVYPMQKQAMRFLNLLGNKIFNLVMTFITQQNLSDTLCGTKALYKKDYNFIKMGLDKWGDYDLLFGAANLGLKIMEVPVHYRARKAGESKMKAMRHAIQLLKACLRGFKELVFVQLEENKRDE